MNHPESGDLPSGWRWPRSTLGDDAVRCLANAVAAVAPSPAVERALSRRNDARFTHLLATGKAAVSMAAAATRWQVGRGRSWRASLVVAPQASRTGAPRLKLLHGDHPVPGSHSVAAAAELGRVVELVTGDDDVLLLLSGGTTSLAGAPIEGLSLTSLQQIFRMLLGSGLDIHASNMVRKHFLRWGGGRLAAALAPATVHAFAISDVPGDSPATIGSGPVSPETSTAKDVAELLGAHGLTLPADAAMLLTAMRLGQQPGLPTPDDPCFARVEYQVVASNMTAIEAAARTARALAYPAEIEPRGLQGEAREAGTRIARRLRALPRGERRALILGGETTVTLGSSAGSGGRSQELALSAAQELQGISDVLLLAAGTDGTDGNSMNAGALVDGGTWARVTDGATHLRHHESTQALSGAGADLFTGPTGTNVMDVVVGLRS